MANALRLLKLPEEMLAALDQNLFTPGHARAVLSVTSPEAQKTLFAAILSQGLSVREAEEMAQKLNGSFPSGGTAKPPGQVVRALPELADLEQRFIERLGTKVTIKGNATKGKLEISYYSSDDLERLCGLLGSPET